MSTVQRHFKTLSTAMQSPDGLSKLKSMAFVYKTRMVDDAKKDTRMPGFNSLYEYAYHELRMRTDIEYGC